MTGEGERLRAEFERSLSPQARERLIHDPALDLAAAAIAENFSDTGRHASAAFAQWLCWRSGSIALYQGRRGGFVGRGIAGRRSLGGSPQALRASLTEWAAAAAEYANASPSGALVYGLARFTEGRITSESIVFGWAVFDVATFLKSYRPGGPLSLRLEPRLPLPEIRFLLDRGDAIEEQTIAPQPDGSFFVSHTVPARSGRYFMEVQGPAPERRTLLFAPIYVGVPEPIAPDGFIQEPPALPSEGRGWTAWLAGIYDAERAKLGRSPVERDAELAALAAQHSILYASGRRAPRVDAEALLARVAGTGGQPSFREQRTLAMGADDALLRLLEPSVRERLVLGERVVLGAGAAPRPVVEDQPRSFELVEESVVVPGAR